MIGDLEESLLPVLRVGERALFVAEELGIEEGGVEPRAVHFDEGSAGARTQVVHHPGDPSLAGPALAGEEHGGPLALRQQPHLVGEVLHAGGGPQGVEPVP